jgi:hypothetical protein
VPGYNRVTLLWLNLSRRLAREPGGDQPGGDQPGGSAAASG